MQALLSAVADTGDRFGESISGEMETALSLAVHWHKYLTSNKFTGIADELLSAMRAAMLEAIGLASMGVARPALTSLRQMIDLLLAWMYFKDHPVEWERVCRTAEGYLMKSEAVEYLKTHYVGFAERFQVLKRKQSRAVDDPYRALSAHIHAQSPHTTPKQRDLAGLIDIDTATQCPMMALAVSEYISDVLFACFADEHRSLPEPLLKSLRSRLAERELADILRPGTISKGR